MIPLKERRLKVAVSIFLILVKYVSSMNANIGL